ncbi:MAG TPA: hypothetical protein DCQ30_08365, partial [Acidimicrobiaceae bacterium]|nr:hypothetical protein [Acidimicrobiaceae bacterium]
MLTRSSSQFCNPNNQRWFSRKGQAFRVAALQISRRAQARRRTSTRPRSTAVRAFALHLWTATSRFERIVNHGDIARRRLRRHRHRRGDDGRRRRQTRAHHHARSTRGSSDRVAPSPRRRSWRGRARRDGVARDPRYAARPQRPADLSSRAGVTGAQQGRGQLYLGAGARGPAWAPPEQSVLVLGPPRSGKTSSLVVPTVLAAGGPVVSTSTKPDVLEATLPWRR